MGHDLKVRQSQPASAGFMPRIKRLIYRTALSAGAKIDEAARAWLDRHTSPRQKAVKSSKPVQMSEDFSDLPAYRGILKHREIGKLFGIANPFYRSHDARRGAETWIEGRKYINFASYDYLGMNDHPGVRDAAKAAIDRFGMSVSASRIVAGERPQHGALETALANFCRVESAITFVSGHATNVSTIGTLLSPGDLILHDELAHNSVIVGAKLSRAATYSFRHNDLNSLEHMLEQHRSLHKNVLIAVEGLYSMDGDVARLPGVIALKEKYGAWLMVDEAHALGVLGPKGRGTAEHFGIDASDVDVWMGTLSKALASCGGYIAGKRELTDILKYQAPGLVYSVGLSPPLAAGALAALEALKTEPERIRRLQANGKLFLLLAKAAGLDTATSEGHAIVSVIVGDMINAGRIAERLLARGLNVLPIIYPAVPLKGARLRFFITSEHTEAHIRSAVQMLREELDCLSKRKKAA
jgi:8-amino-7-oxononanoate synthase